MMRRVVALPLLFVLLSQCARDSHIADEKADPAQETSRKSDGSKLPTVSRSFEGSGIKTVVLRAGNAALAEVHQTTGSRIEVSGTPRGGAGGYHSPDATWRETRAADWGLDFVAVRHQNTLVISTKNESHFIHHSYYFDSLVLSVPSGVEVVPVARELTGSGAPDLSLPL